MHLEQIAKLGSFCKHFLDRLTLLEFKNLLAGDLKLRAEIVNLAGKFTWMTCGSTDHNRVHNCDVVKHLTGGVFSVTGRKTEGEETLNTASLDTATVTSCESPAQLTGGVVANEGESEPNTPGGNQDEGESHSACDMLQQVNECS